MKPDQVARYAGILHSKKPFSNKDIEGLICCYMGDMLEPLQREIGIQFTGLLEASTTKPHEIEIIIPPGDRIRMMIGSPSASGDGIQFNEIIDIILSLPQTEKTTIHRMLDSIVGREAEFHEQLL